MCCRFSDVYPRHLETLGPISSLSLALQVVQPRCFWEGGGCTHRMYGGRSRMTIDPRIPTMLGRSTSGFHRPGSPCLHQARSAVRCLASRMKGELHPTKNSLCEADVSGGGIKTTPHDKGWVTRSRADRVGMPSVGNAGVRTLIDASDQTVFSLPSLRARERALDVSCCHKGDKNRQNKRE